MPEIRLLIYIGKKKPESLQKLSAGVEDDHTHNLGDLLVDPADNPEAIYLCNLILKELDLCLKKLPAPQPRHARAGVPDQHARADV